MVDGAAALLAQFGSQLADDRLLIPGILKEVGSSTVEQISDRIDLQVAVAERLLEMLVMAGLAVRLEGGAKYQAGGQHFDELIEYLSTAETAPRRS